MPKLDNFRVKFVIIPGEKVILDVCYDHKSPAGSVNRFRGFAIYDVSNLLLFANFLMT